MRERREEHFNQFCASAHHFNSFYTYQLCILQLWISISPNLAYFVNGKQHGFYLCTVALNKHLGASLPWERHQSSLADAGSLILCFRKEWITHCLNGWEKKKINIMYLKNYSISNICGWVNLVQAIVPWQWHLISIKAFNNTVKLSLMIVLQYLGLTEVNTWYHFQMDIPMSSFCTSLKLLYS